MFDLLLANASPEDMRSMLQDFQASLTTALARIHSLKSREKQLIKENAELRAIVHDLKNAKEQAAQAITKADDPNAAAEPLPAAVIESAADSDNVTASQDQVVTLSSVERQPLYISHLDKQVPVYMHWNGRKVAGSLVVDSKMLDFVEVKARIEAKNFLGITVTKDAYINPQIYMNADHPSSPNNRTWKKKLSWCVNTPNVQHEDVAGPYSDDSSSSSPRQAHTRHRSWHSGEASENTGMPLPPQPPAWDSSNVGAWKIVWKANDMPQQLTFEASKDTREFLHKHTERWLTKPDRQSEDDVTLGIAMEEGDIEVCSPVCLVSTASPHPRLSEPSRLFSHEQAASLAAALPNRYRLSRWTLAYSTKNHGFSLQTLYRKAAGGAPCMLFLKDQAGYVFGAFTSEAWKVSPRFFGTGETFVFQLEPHGVMYSWNERCKSKNDYFMYAQPDCLGVGGCGRFAFWVDSELLHGTSGTCATFGSPCLAHAEEFKVMGVELWHIG